MRRPKVHVPQHPQVDPALTGVLAEGGLAIFKTGFYGAFLRTYYPTSVITAINQMWSTHADALSPRTKLSLIAAEFSRRTYHGRVYAKAQNVRSSFIGAYDAALANVDVLVMPTCLMTAPKNQRPPTYMEALEDNLASANSRVTANTLQFDYTGHPALAVPVGKSPAGLPASMQLVGRFFDDPLLLRVAYAYQHSVDWESLTRVGAAV
jgi:amidase